MPAEAGLFPLQHVGVHRPERGRGLVPRSRRRTPHRDDDPLTTAAGTTGGRSGRGDATVRQRPKTRAATSVARAGSTSPTRTAVSSAGAKRAACCRARSARVSDLDDLDRPLRPAAVRVTAGVQLRHQPFDRANGGIVVVLPDRRDDLALRSRDLLFGAATAPSRCRRATRAPARNLRQGRCRRSRTVTRDGDGQRDAAAVELFRDHPPPTATSVPRSMRRDSRQVAPGCVSRIADRAGAHGQIDRDGGCLVCLLGDDDRRRCRDRADRGRTGLRHRVAFRLSST